MNAVSEYIDNLVACFWNNIPAILYDEMVSEFSKENAPKEIQQLHKVMTEYEQVRMRKD